MNQSWVGFFKKSSDRCRSLDEALCQGWIDGRRENVDAERFVIRATPWIPGSIWSLVSVRHAERLIAEGQMKSSGAAAFAARRSGRVGVYSFEQQPKALPAGAGNVFRKNKRLWAFWTTQLTSYSRVATWWVIQAKQEATRKRHLAQLIAHYAKEQRLPQFTVSKKAPPMHRKKGVDK
jgi:uncharacterized protein YdeI (YjbR/CyaY-like superfamily)